MKFTRQKSLNEKSETVADKSSDKATRNSQRLLKTLESMKLPKKDSITCVFVLVTHLLFQVRAIVSDLTIKIMVSLVAELLTNAKGVI